MKHSRDYDAKDFPAACGVPAGAAAAAGSAVDRPDREIAYSTADLDDGVEARILTREQVRGSVPVFARLYMEVEQRLSRSRRETQVQ